MIIALDFDGLIHDITAVKQRYARDARHRGQPADWPAFIELCARLAARRESLAV